MITGDKPLDSKTIFAETYKESLIETINFLDEIKKKKLQKIEVKNYLEEMKSSIRLNFDYFEGSYSERKRIRYKEDFLEQFKGSSLLELKGVGITLFSPVFEFNFQEGYPRLGYPSPFKESNYKNSILVTFLGRPKFFTEGLQLSSLSDQTNNSTFSANSIYKFSVRKEKDKDFFESFYKSLEGYRKRTINDKIDLLKSDYVGLFNSSISNFEDSRIFRLQKVRNLFGLELLKIDNMNETETVLD